MDAKEKKLRTLAQNKAAHLYFTMLADAFNSAGMDMKRVLKPTIAIAWTPESIKNYLWKPIQDAMFQKKSTTELNTDEVTKVYEVLNRHSAEKFGIGIQFPSIENSLFDEMIKKIKL